MSTKKVAEDKLEFWNQLRTPPASALKKITGGRMAGKTDIKPQWRYQAMTEVYGPCGMGWKFTIDRLWTEPGPDGNVFAFAQVSVYTKTHPTGGTHTWSDPIPGVGGNKMVEKEKAGLHASDDCFKMAVTDALSTALKMLGVAADIYSGEADGSKRNKPAPKNTVAPKPPAPSQASEVAPESTQPPPEASAPASAPVEGELSEIGVIEKVAKKAGKKSNGDPFTRYGILMKEAWYGTFSESLGNLALTSRDSKLDVEIIYTVDAKGFKNVVSLNVLDEKTPF